MNKAASDYFMRVTKEESISTLTHDIIKNTFVLRISEPFPGYYGADFIKASTTPGNILFILKKEVDFEFFYRKNYKIKQYCEHNFDATPAMVYMFNQKFPAIRIRNINEFDFIEEVQQNFMDEGFKMAKIKKINTKAIIKISKFESISEIKDGIYTDAENINFKYLRLPFKLNWKLFEKITLEIKRNVNLKQFDAAKGVFYTKDNIIDFVRIYSTYLSESDIELLRNKYLEAMQRYVVVSDS
jgi:hypothetical protein